MLRLLVLTAWLSIIPAVLYRLRHVPEIRGYFAGFAVVWHSILTLKDQEDRYKAYFPDHGGSENFGMLTAVVTAFIVGFLVLVFAGFTIYWAG